MTILANLWMGIRKGKKKKFENPIFPQDTLKAPVASQP
jgi:hypothetical protein